MNKAITTNTDVFEKAWEGFKGTDWRDKASVTRFVQANYTPYDGDESFLAGPTERSLKIKKIIEETKARYEATRFSMDVNRATSIADIPDAYSRGRIIGMYTRFALYGADYLKQEKVNDWNAIS